MGTKGTEEDGGVGVVSLERFWARDIREEPGVTEVLDLAEAKYPRLGELRSGLHWSLARGPERGSELRVGDVRRYLTKTSALGPDFPVLTVLYQFDDNYVTILSVKISVGEYT